MTASFISAASLKVLFYWRGDVTALQADNVLTERVLIVTLQKTDIPDQVRLSNLQPGSYVFQLTVTDSKDQSHSAKVTVVVLSPELSTCE